MTTLQQWAKVVSMDAAGQLDSASSAALNELRKRATQFGQNLAQFIEPALTVGSGVAGSIAGGFVGAAGLPYGVDVAANAVKRTRDWMTYVPRTEAGRKGLAQVGSAMGNLENRVNTATGIASGALTYGATGDVTQAANVGTQVYQEGLGEAAGGYVTDKTGSPFLGTATKLIPDIADAVIGMKGIKPALQGLKQFEMGDIGSQQFGQRGAVGGVGDSNVRRAYHGTDDADFEDFSIDKFGENYGTQGEPSIYTTTSKGDAAFYGRETKELDVDTSNYERFDAMENLRETYDSFESYQDVPFDEWVDSMGHEELINVLDFDNLIGNAARYAKKEGKRGVVADFTGTNGGDVILSFDPKDIKSVRGSTGVQQSVGEFITKPPRDGGVWQSIESEHGRIGLNLTGESDGIIGTVKVNPDMRGKGEGVKLYEEAIKATKEKGLSRLLSDETVTPEAKNVWDALERRGHKVVKHPTTKFINDKDGGFWSADGDNPPFSIEIK